MPRFKTKDLLVTVVPKVTEGVEAAAKACLLRTAICRYPSCGGCTLSITCRCSVLMSCANFTCVCSYRTFGCDFFGSCGRGGSACDPTDIPCFGSEFVIESKEDLVTLRTELQETLKQLDEIEKAGVPTSIGSKAEAEALERGLTEALEQVRAAKKGLK